MRKTPISKLILASASPFRQALLGRLGLDFEIIPPEIDESMAGNESADAAVIRLARAKAAGVAAQVSGALVIASDQLAECRGRVFGKPGHAEAARIQLKQMRGESLFFYTGLCLLNTETRLEQLDCVVYRVNFRPYTDEEIERYLRADAPWNCAGSFKSEQLGITLVESMEGPDPSALVGLPLIRLAAMLRQEGVDLP